jgi:cysteine desulfurase / selenocysteine lyase
MVYLDHAATSWPKPKEVIDAWVGYHREVEGSPGRGAHAGAVEGARRVEGARKTLADFLGIDDPRRFVFTPSCTHAMNLAIRGVLRRGDHAIATAIDHNSALRPLAAVAKDLGVELTIAPAGRDGIVGSDAVRAAVRRNTRLVVCTHASNAFGTIQDVAAFVEIARAAGARILLDAAQSAGILPIDAKRLGVDFVAVPGHKSLLGPSGIGGLYVASGVEIPPDHFGGTGLDSSNLTPPVSWPGSFEAGTGNPAGITAWGAGVRVVADEGLDSIRRRERELLARMEEGLARLPKIALHGSRDLERRVGVLSFTVEGYDPNEVAAILDSSFEIRVRSGQLCAPEAIRAAGAPEAGVVRASLGFTSTADEVDALVGAVAEIVAS